MVFQVRTAEGIPVGADTPITVEFELLAQTDGGGEFLTPLSDVTDENGRVRTVLNSGTVAGVTETVARITSPATLVREASESASTRICPLLGTLPSRPRTQRSRACALRRSTTDFCACLRSVPESSANGDVLSTSLRSTLASRRPIRREQSDERPSLLIAVNQLPPIGAATGRLDSRWLCGGYAQTADSGGDADPRYNIRLALRAVQSSRTSRRPSFTIADGGCQNFTFNVWDLNENPLSAGYDHYGHCDVRANERRYGR